MPARTQALRIALWGAAVLIAFWAAADPRFRGPAGNLHALSILPFALAASLAVLATTLAGEWKLAGRWSAVGLIGQAVTLQLITAGPVVGYHDYKNMLAEFTNGRVFSAAALAWLGFQTATIAIGLAKRQTELRSWFVRHVRLWQFAAMVAIIAFSSATFTVLFSAPSPWVLLGDGSELATAAYLQVLNLGTIVLVGLSMPERGAVSLLDRIGLGETSESEARWGMDRFVLVLAAAASFVLTAALSTLSYQRHPHVPDEVSYLMQARYFAAAQLWLVPPPVPEAFSIDLMHFGPDKLYTASPPGWPAMLAVGVFLGAPWLVNPALGALNVILAYLLLIGLYERRTARLATFLLAASPWNVFLAMSFMPHIFTMTSALGAAHSVLDHS